MPGRNVPEEAGFSGGGGFMPKINSLKAALICSKYSRKNPPLKGREQLRIRQDPCHHLCGGADTG